MQLGMTSGVAVYDGVGYEDAIDHLIWQAKFADEAGFKRLWLVEHHFTDFAMTGAPSPILAHFAAVTSRVRIGYAVAVLPLHHPIRLAEEITWVDNLSKGRLMVGVGPGFSPLEYGVYGVSVDRKREYVEENLALIRKALTGDKFSWEGEIWQIPEIQIQPPPYRGRSIPFYMATSSHESVARAARWGVTPLLGFRPPDVLKDQIKLWRSVREEMGDTQAEINEKQKEIGVLRRLVVGRDEAEAAALTEQGSIQFAEAIRRLNTASGDTGPREIDALQPDGTRVRVSLADEDQRARSSRNAEVGTIQGTKSQVIEKLYELQETGVGHVLGGFGGRGMPLSQAKSIMEMVASDILPLFND